MLAPTTIDIIKSTVPVIERYGAEVTTVFYQNLLRENPALNEVFNQGNQASGHQTKALAAAVLAYAKYIETPEVLGEAIGHINEKHASLFIKAEHYPIVGQYLLGAFAQVLGDAFTPEIHNAWAEAYGQLAQIMIAAEARLYQDAQGWTDWRDFIVKDKIEESSEITSFILSPKDEHPLPPYLPGQYVSVRIFVPALGYTQIRQYSLSDSFTAATSHYRISVRREPGVKLNDTEHPGLVSTVLHAQVNVGDTVQLSMPQGHFTLEPPTQTPSPIVLISAGVGITPMLAMLKTSLANAPERQLTWIHGANTSQKRAFAAQVDAITKGHSTVRTVRFLTNPSESDTSGVDYEHVGRVDLGKCNPEKELYIGDALAGYYICGPDAFMTAVTAQLMERGVEAARIQSERFATGGS